jgi:hypothetical protein
VFKVVAEFSIYGRLLRLEPLREILFAKFARPGCWLLGWLALVCGSAELPAQGTFTVLNTGGGQAVVSETRSFLLGTGLIQPRLAFRFGFATDEQVLPGAFLDSFTVTLQDAGQTLTAIYLTADAAGLWLAPASPGTIPLNATAFEATAIGYPPLLPVLGSQQAFQFSAPIPAQFAGLRVNVFFDLFDNLDLQPSQAWFADVQVVDVPEPGLSQIGLLGLLLWGCASLRLRAAGARKTNPRP